MINCAETRLKISEMFDHLTPCDVDKTRAEIDPHLLKCRECREFLKEKYAEKEKEIRK